MRHVIEDPNARIRWVVAASTDYTEVYLLTEAEWRATPVGNRIDLIGGKLIDIGNVFECTQAEAITRMTHWAERTWAHCDNSARVYSAVHERKRIELLHAERERKAGRAATSSK